MFFGPLGVAVASLGEDGDGLGGAFRAFVRFVLVWICRFSLSLGVWEGLRFVIVALTGLTFFMHGMILHTFNARKRDRLKRQAVRTTREKDWRKYRKCVKS